MSSMQYENLNARQLAGQLIMVRLPGTELDTDAARFLSDNRIRAICLFRKNMTDGDQLAALTSALRSVMGKNALIAIDQEGGAVVRATWLPAPPSGMALGATDDPALCREVGAAVARGLKSLGFNWNFAPVLDITNNLDNPVIAERSFGADPKRAAELALAWMEGSLAEGVACCVKHFPGHGDTHVDSHRDLPTVDKPRAALDALEFVPFRAALNAPAMMSAHIVYPALDPANPATLSKPILSGLLREEWGYRGVVITDGMDMRAIADRYGAGAAAVMALQAGADMVMSLGTRETQEETLNEIAAAIEDGTLERQELVRRLARLDRLAADFPSAAPAYTTQAEDGELMARAWKRALTAHRSPQVFPRGTRVRLVARADVVSDGVTEAGVPAERVAQSLRRFYDVELMTYRQDDEINWSALPADGRKTVLASTTRLRHGPRARAEWKPDLHLVLWNPILALDIDAPALLTYGYVRPALDAVEAWLSGKLDAGGHVPLERFGGR